MPSTGANIHKKLLLLALLALATVVTSSSGQQQHQRRRVSSLFSIFIRMRNSHCRSEVRAARLAWRQCFQLCVDNWRASAERAKFRGCHMRCLHRFVLVTPSSGDAYDKLVAAAGCDAGQEWARCRTEQLQQLVSTGEADAVSQLSQVQRYNLLVCQHHCGSGEGAAGCKAMCLLRQVMEPEAFKKLSSCLDEADCDKTSGTGAGQDGCKRRCYKKC